MKRSKTIVVWGGEDILSLSMEMFLSSKTDWQVTRISNTEKPEAVIQAVEALQPDTVLIHEGDQTFPRELISQLLQEHTSIKVIMICLDTNEMDVYSKQKILARDPFDLIGAIESEPFHITIPSEWGKKE